MIRRYLLTAVLLAVTVTFLGGQQLFPELRKYGISSEYPVYTPDDLWDYINGAADGYLALGFIDLNIREYKRGKTTIKVEIYRFGDDARAFGIYSMERAPGYNFIPVGVQGYNEDGALNFYKDRYYVKIMSHSGSVKVNAAMVELAGLISSRIEGKSEFPALLGLFPAEGRLKNEETYVLESVLGHDFLRGAFRVAYEVEGDRFDIHLFNREDMGEVVTMASRLAGDAWSADEAVFKYAFEDGFNGVIYMAREGGKLIVISGLGPDKTALAEKYISGMLEH
ncbi:MAG: hypothetical protein RBT50_04515 [Bacteroidales bacterium]|jgi:hypothetical protein|nr:hypothetical protein [Bacteroidales bacterium]